MYEKAPLRSQISTARSIIDNGLICCTLRSITAFAQKPHFPGATVNQWLSQAETLSQDHSWEILSSSYRRFWLEDSLLVFALSELCCSFFPNVPSLLSSFTSFGPAPWSEKSPILFWPPTRFPSQVFSQWISYKVNLDTESPHRIQTNTVT